MDGCSSSLVDTFDELASSFSSCLSTNVRCRPVLASLACDLAASPWVAFTRLLIPIFRFDHFAAQLVDDFDDLLANLPVPHLTLKSSKILSTHSRSNKFTRSFFSSNLINRSKRFCVPSKLPVSYHSDPTCGCRFRKFFCFGKVFQNFFCADCSNMCPNRMFGKRMFALRTHCLSL